MAAPIEASRRWSSRLGRLDPFQALCVLLALAFVGLLVVPLVNILRTAVLVDGSVSLDGVRAAFGSPRLPRILFDTLRVVLPAAAGAVAIGSGFAWLNERSDARLGWISTTLPLVPLLLPPVALAVGWVFLAQSRAGYLNVAIRRVIELLGGTPPVEGPLNIATWGGLVWVYTLFLVPFAYLVVAAALRNLDARLEEASLVNGASQWRTFRAVALPAVRPAILSGFLLATMTGFSLFSVPIVIGTPARIEVLSVHIVRLVRLSFPPRIVEGVVLSLLLMAMVGAIWYLQQRASRHQRHATLGGKAGGATLVELGRFRWPARALMLLYLVVASLLPLSALVLVSLQSFWSPSFQWSSLGLGNFRELFGAGLPRRGLQTSVTLGLSGATVGTMVAAVLMTYAHVRRQRPIGRIVDGVTKAPGVISNIVIGVAFLVTLAGSPFNLHGTITLLFLAYLVIYMPQASITAGSAVGQIGGELVESSLMSGAGQMRTFRRINVPLMLPGLVAGWSMLFVLMVGDLTASALLAGPRNPVIGFVILSTYEHGTLPELAALATAICAISLVVVGVVLYVSRRLQTRTKVPTGIAAGTR